MSQSLRESRAWPTRNAGRRLGIVVLACIVYGAFLFGTSAILADPGTAQIELPGNPIQDLTIGDWAPSLGSWSPTTARLPRAVH